MNLLQINQLFSYSTMFYLYDKILLYSLMQKIGDGTIATLHLMVGLPYSGKTTLARKLEEKYSALRLTPDEWHIRLFGQDMDESEHNDRHDLVESLLWDVAARVLVIGADVILDFGFWGRRERDDFRSRASELGADFKIHFLDVPEEMLLKRLAARNTELPQYTYPLPETMLKEWIQSFETPSQEEFE